MISHALTIINNELEQHFDSIYTTDANSSQVQLGNIAEGFAGGGSDGGVGRDMLILSVVNIKEEKSLKNVPTYVRNDIQLKTSYENPPVFVNFLILVTATHNVYSNALLVLSRTLRFFQSKNVFTHDNVAPASITLNEPANVLDRLETFKLIFDLYSPTVEEVNHLWGTLGGKQYPFALYMMRMLDLKFRSVQSESGLITEIVNEFSHKNAN
jgi:hypothetical protein